MKNNLKLVNATKIVAVKSWRHDQQNAVFR